jgi:DNA-binding CsgD family transcriptional regulator
MQGLNIFECMDRLREKPRVDERWSEIIRIFDDLGFDQINYAVLNTASAERDTAAVTQFSSMDRTWIDHYLSNRLDLHDPHVRFVRQMGFQPYFFDQRRARTLEAEEAKVIKQAAEAGLRAQISVVFPDHVGTPLPIGGMTIGSSRHPDDFYASVRGSEQSLVSIAMLFHALSIGQVRAAQLGLEPLSPRERDALSFVAEGLRVGRIAEKMNVAEVTVELHLRNARRKLKSATLGQAVARAIMIGAVTP